ncbi:MAG: hypothetical protein GY885_12120, partial [Phycisphaeraceae bacterium]|nr:hypothetical protein [Phycisphaeraceae bacterium]
MIVSTLDRPAARPVDTATAIDTDRDSMGRPIDLRLDANECRSADGRIAIDAIGAFDIDPAAYPDRRSLESVIAMRAGIDPDRVVVTAGADDAIDRICREAITPGDRMTLLDPTFPMFERFAV